MNITTFGSAFKKANTTFTAATKNEPTPVSHSSSQLTFSKIQDAFSTRAKQQCANDDTLGYQDDISD